VYVKKEVKSGSQQNEVVILRFLFSVTNPKKNGEVVVGHARRQILVQQTTTVKTTNPCYHGKILFSLFSFASQRCTCIP
jgi:hypothetical protein